MQRAVCVVRGPVVPLAMTGQMLKNLRLADPVAARRYAVKESMSDHMCAMTIDDPVCVNV